MDPPKRYNLNDLFTYRFGNLEYARAEKIDENAAEVRVALRIKNRATRHSHWHHFNATVTANPTEFGISFDVRLQNKKGFPGEAEQRMQDEIDKVDMHFDLPPELIEAGVIVEKLTFSGTSENGSFNVHARLSAPLTAIPALVQYGFSLTNRTD